MPKFQVLGGDHTRCENGEYVCYIRGMVFESDDDVRERWPNAFLLVDDAVEVSVPYEEGATPSKIDRAAGLAPLPAARKSVVSDPANDPEIQALAAANQS